MLTLEIKNKIDAARDILVGKVPDPKAQVEQITTALIYKFMDDMDKQAASLPKGKAQFFTNGFEKYAWGKMMDAKLGGQERLNLYVEACAQMSKNPHLPQLFRDIFKDAFLPYRDPETLNLFLKEISSFNYDHSENLGDAFEYLLSVLGSQGDAGQFRTPRHIIDFIVEVVDPKKDESILDPACGTAGFLISAYKHILKENKNKPLTPDEKKRLMCNLSGYDISPDMVKLSLVNMYLHGFPSPNISEYDTLTSEEKWDERFDIMMANPPFMTPKGGIRPHNRFSVDANRSEILFVDYIVEHLNSKGRAGIIVPEGIIFTASNAYKQLRKLLVEDGLYAVVSLPAGVFNPYSNVKTCILFFDNQLAKQSKEILFLKILNDGFGLGAQRRKGSKDDLPQALEVLQAQRVALKTGTKNTLLKKDSLSAWAVSKEQIAKNGDYSLLGDGYRAERVAKKSKWQMVEMGEVANFVRGPFGSSIKRSVCVPKGKNTYKVYEQGNIIQNDFNRGEYYLSEEKFKALERFELKPGDIVITCAGTLGKTAIAPEGIEKGVINSVLMRLRVDESKILQKYFVLLLNSPEIQERIVDKATGVAVKNMFATSELKKFKIPLPPISEQKKILAMVGDEEKKVNELKEKIKKHQLDIKSKIAEVWGE